MRRRIWSAASCISRSGSRMGAIRRATEDNRPICSARCWLSRLGSPQRLVRPLHLARPLCRPCAACSCASTRRRADSSSWALEERLEPLVAELAERDQRLGERLVVRAGPYRAPWNEAAVENPDLERCDADPARAVSNLALGPPRLLGEEPLRRRRRPAGRAARRARPCTASRASPSGCRAAATARTQSREDRLSLRQQALGRLLQRRARRLIAACLAAVQVRDAAVSRSYRTSRKPASSISAANAAGAGKLATDAGR